MSNKKFQFKLGDRMLTVMRSEYQYGSCKQPAILCFDDTDPECSVASGIPYGILTVNLDHPACEPLNDGETLMQFLDINNWPGIESILADHKDWCEPAGFTERCGFVEYPLWYFSSEIPHV